MSIDAHSETLSFQAEVKQLLDLMIHSLYSNREIFLRELVSNASDACDKLRFEGLSDDALFEADPNLAITVTADKDARTVTIRDNGIGMSRQEVIDNVGTIAKSGTKQFMSALTGDQAKDAHLIGQFGVGFYSAFIVADKVTLTTRRAGLTPEHGVRWVSAGDGQFTLETVERPQRGTEVVLHLRQGEEFDSFLEDWTIKSTIRKYSDHITFPIQMPIAHGDNAGELEKVNAASALWTQPKEGITPEEYDSFYEHVAHDFEPPLAHIHATLEGRQEYTVLLYLPKRAPFDLWDREQKHGVKLFVKRVFIMEATEELMPRYLRFVRGVIDSSDLPLNVSREILQQNPLLDAIKKGAVKKVLDLLKDLAKDKPEDFATFWKTFGVVLKEGVIEDRTNQERIAKLLRFNSTAHTEEQTVALADYVERMKEGQKAIYYITAENPAAAAKSPHLEIFRKKGIEVLLLTDRIDEWLVEHLTEFDDKPLVSVAKGNLDLGDLETEEEKEQHKQEEEQAADLTARIGEILGEKVEKVRITHRLTDSPACLVAPEGGMSGQLERIMKEMGQNIPTTAPILEINPHNPVVERLKSSEGETAADLAWLLLDQALLAEGGKLADPGAFVARLNRMLAG